MPSKSTSDAGASQDAGPSNGARRVKGKRTRTGCLTCRARKVKCDETPGTCANCERVLLACRWPEVRNVLDERAAARRGAASTPMSDPSPQQAPSSGPIRINRNSGCTSCRSVRARCSQDRPSCGRCVEQGLNCDYSSDATGVTPTSTGASPRDTTISQNHLFGMPRPVLDRHVDAFFTYVYPVQANAHVHRGTFLKDLADGRASKKLVLAICAIAARFVEHTPGVLAVASSEAATAWETEAKAALLNDDLSLDNVATALLLAKHAINGGRYSQAFVLSAVANRNAMALNLYMESTDTSISLTERETRRRLMWGCYCLDRMMSTGVAEFLLTPAQSLHIRLPCDDQKYMYGIATDAPFPALEVEADEGGMGRFEAVGILGHYVRLNGIRSMILRVTRNRSLDDLPPWDPTSAFAQAERKIQAWRGSLSQQFQLEPETLYARQYQNQLPSLVMLHIWYNQNLSELHRLAFPGFATSLPPDVVANAPAGWIERMRDASALYARMIAQTLRHVSSLVDTDKLIWTDTSLPICVYESVRTRLQYAFLLPPAPQAAELAELLADVEVMTGYLQRMGEHFTGPRWLLKETRKVLQRHGLDSSSAHSSRASSPAAKDRQDPWSRRVRSLRDPPRPHVSHGPTHSLSQHSMHSVSSSSGHANSLPTPKADSMLNQGPAPTAGVMYAEPQSYVPASTSPLAHNGWPTGYAAQQAQDEVAALLGEYQATNTTGVNSLFGMFGDWIATGYDANAGVSLPLNGTT